MTAFGAHFLKEVSHAQLTSAAKQLLPPNIRKTLVGAEKTTFIVTAMSMMHVCLVVQRWEILDEQIARSVILQ